jgi:glycosyltransferase involved in cell wall biosynthesis
MADMDAPLVSVVVPVLNCDAYLCDALESVLTQDYAPWELVVVDDHSTDCSVAMAEAFAVAHADRTIRVLRNDGKGKVAALNRGIADARGDFIHLFGADDQLRPTCLSECVCAVRRTGCDAIYHDLLVVDELLRPLNVLAWSPDMERLSFEAVAANLVSIGSGAWLFNRRLCASTWPIDAEVPYEDMWMSLLFKLRGEVAYLPRALYNYRQHGRQTYGRLDDRAPERRAYRCRRDLQVLGRIMSDASVAPQLPPRALKALGRWTRYLRAMVEGPSVSSMLLADMTVRQKAGLVGTRLLPDACVRLLERVLRGRRIGR